MLVVPFGSPEVLLEVASGLTLSPASALVEGALRKKIPVLFEAAFLSKWCEAVGEEREERWKTARRIADSLTKRGMEFISAARSRVPDMQAPKASVPVVRDAVRLGGGGWLSWSEVAPLVIKAKTVFLTNGTKLTLEAADRLMKLNVKIEEVF